MESLPEEIRGLICFDLDIKTIENVYLCYKLDLLPGLQFWNHYFKLCDLTIVNKRNNIVDWINEFKIVDMMNNLNKLDSIPCGHTFVRGTNKGKQCNKITDPGFEYCAIHLKMRRIEYSEVTPKTKNVTIKYKISDLDLSCYETLCVISDSEDSNVTITLSSECVVTEFRTCNMAIVFNTKTELYTYLGNLFNKYPSATII